MLLRIFQKLSIVCFGSREERRWALHEIGLRLRGVDFDFVSTEALGLPDDRAHYHANSGDWALEAVLAELDISPHDSVLDLGCGKGGAMMILARFPFGRVDGVELSHDLATIARRNFRRLRMKRSRVFCCDAGVFDDYDPYSFLYLYNPFPDVVVREVLARLSASRARHPRDLTLIYKNPVSHDALCERGFTLARSFQPAGREPINVYTLRR